MFKFYCNLCGAEFDNVDGVKKHLKEHHRVEERQVDYFRVDFDEVVLDKLKEIFGVDGVHIKDFGHAGVWLEFTISAYMMDFFWNEVAKFMNKLVELGAYPEDCSYNDEGMMFVWSCSVYLEYAKIEKLIGDSVDVMKVYEVEGVKIEREINKIVKEMTKNEEL